MWTSSANQIYKCDEQNYTALLTCVLTECSINISWRKEWAHVCAHTHLSPSDICASRNTFFSSLTCLSGPLQLTPPWRNQSAIFCENFPDYFKQSSISIPWVLTTPFTAVSQHVSVHFVTLVSPPDCEHLRDKDTSSSSLNPQETEHHAAQNRHPLQSFLATW